MSLQKAYFRIDDSKFYEGWHNPQHRWNGWACPWFSKETLLEIAADIALILDDNPTSDSVVFGWFETDGYDPNTDKLEDYNVVHDRITPEHHIPHTFIYCIDGICWDAYTAEEMLDDLIEEFDLRSYIRDTAEMLRSEAKAKGIKLPLSLTAIATLDTEVKAIS